VLGALKVVLVGIVLGLAGAAAAGAVAPAPALRRAAVRRSTFLASALAIAAVGACAAAVPALRAARIDPVAALRD
jgi:ABC-type antimicrobial peptide transport system permease subunit